jgi:hypothetical protein
MRQKLVLYALPFLSILNAYTRSQYKENAPNLKVGDEVYLAIKFLCPGQMRFSQKNIDLKINEVKNEYGINKNGKFMHDNGKSPFSMEEPAPVLKMKDEDGSIKYVLQDKHHNTLATNMLAKQNGMSDKATMPVKVTKDLSHMPYKEFWQYAHKNFLADLVGVDGKLYLDSPPRSFNDMQNDPVRYFVTIAALRIQNGKFLNNWQGAEFPLWVKRRANSTNPKLLPGDIANEQMIENVVSQKLIDNGFTYDDARDGESGSSFNAKVIEAHNILSDPKNSAWIKEKGLRLVKKPGYIKDIMADLKKLAAQPDPLAKKD